MKIRLITTAIIALFSFAFVGSISAQSSTPKVTKNQVQQQKRIHQGVKSGELTRAETIRLQKQQQRIHQSKKQAKADGKVTRRERRMIRSQQRTASRNINRQKNDAQSRR